MARRIGKSVRPETDWATKPSQGRARSLANLKRGGSPGRKPGIPNAATLEIRQLASRLLVEDEEWIASARRRMIAGEAPHLETFFLSHKYRRMWTRRPTSPRSCS